MPGMYASAGTHDFWEGGHAIPPRPQGTGYPRMDYIMNARTETLAEVINWLGDEADRK